MGGLGSGNHWRYGTRKTVEGSRAIDARHFRRKGLIPGPSSCNWQWSRDGEQVANINVRVEDRHTVVLDYRYRLAGDEEWEQVDQRIPLEWTQCHLGGERPWFVCPVYRNGVYCGQRVAKLYGAGKWFACRHCYNLAYQSQNETPLDRLTSKAQKIRMRLGGSASLMEFFPEKPKGMHWRTYERLRAEAEQAEQASWIGVAERFGIEF